MEIVVSYLPSKEWFWIQKRESEYKDGDESKTYTYEMLWDGTEDGFFEKRRESRAAGNKPRPIKPNHSYWIVDEPYDDILSEGMQCAICAIFDDEDELWN